MAWKRRGPILVSALHNLSLAYLLRHLTTYVEPRDLHWTATRQKMSMRQKLKSVAASMVLTKPLTN